MRIRASVINTCRCSQRYSSINATGKDLFVLQSAPVLQLRDAAGNAVVGFRGTFEVRSSGGDATTQLGFGNKMSFHAGGSRVTLRGIFMTTQKSRDLGISLLFRSSCCSLLSQVSDDIRSSTLNLSGAATGMQMSISSSITSGEPFSIVATAVAQDGGTAYGFQGRVAITLPLASEGFVHTGAKQAQNGMARFDNLVMTRVGNFDAELTGFPIGYFTPELQSSQAVRCDFDGRLCQQSRFGAAGLPAEAPGLWQDLPHLLHCARYANDVCVAALLPPNRCQSCTSLLLAARSPRQCLGPTGREPSGGHRPIRRSGCRSGPCQGHGARYCRLPGGDSGGCGRCHDSGDLACRRKGARLYPPDGLPRCHHYVGIGGKDRHQQSAARGVAVSEHVGQSCHASLCVDAGAGAGLAGV